MIVDYNRIGQRVKESRRQRRMTQAELAAKTNISDTYISRIETGAKKASLGSLIKIVIALDISLDSLVLDDSSVHMPKGYREF